MLPMCSQGPAAAYIIIICLQQVCKVGTADKRPPATPELHLSALSGLCLSHLHGDFSGLLSFSETETGKPTRELSPINLLL